MDQKLMGPRRDRDQYVKDPSDAQDFGSHYERPNYKKLPDFLSRNWWAIDGVISWPPAVRLLSGLNLIHNKLTNYKNMTYLGSLTKLDVYIKRVK